MASKLLEDMTPPSLAEILTDFRWMLTLPSEKCDWEQVINYFGHIELYRREIVEVAKETIESKPSSANVVKMLERLANEDLSRRRRETYLSTFRLLCRYHIHLYTCGEQEYIVPSLLKKYYPPVDESPSWIPHVGLTEKERELIARDKLAMLDYLREVNEWEGGLEKEQEDRQRELYVARFGGRFGQVSGKPSLGEVALSFAAKVENNANALERILTALDYSLST